MKLTSCFAALVLSASGALAQTPSATLFENVMVFDTATKLYNSGDPVDALTVGSELQRAGDLVHRRPESEGPAAEGELDPARWPDSPARRLLRELAGDGPLVERLSLAQERVEREVRLDSATAGILTLDRCRVLRGGRQWGEFGIVELELSADGLDRADTLGEALAAVPGLQPEPESKLGLALAALRDSR